jgi:hypothetical protein
MVAELEADNKKDNIVHTKSSNKAGMPARN